MRRRGRPWSGRRAVDDAGPLLERPARPPPERLTQEPHDRSQLGRVETRRHGRETVRLEEAEVEGDVVPDDPGVADERGELGQDRLGGRRPGELLARDAGEPLHDRGDLALARDDRDESLAERPVEPEAHGADLEEAILERI